jgi:dihydrofolate synthase/folylpolyglutamate synthase
MMTDNPRIAALLERLYHPGLARIDLSLARVERFLDRLGNPHKKLPSVVHVAGTNGKGSLLANVHSILNAAGYTVHRYISPHLVRFNERITIADAEIDDSYLESLLKRVVAEVEKQPVTFFEATTVAAFLAFSENPADIVLLETGMGGALDATNVVDRPLLTAITPIALDHTDFLGKTLAKIAGEKAGIIKQGVPCIVGRQEKEAEDIINNKALELDASLYRMGVEWDWRKEGARGVYHSPKRSACAFVPGLKGSHQYDNAATAIACIDQLTDYRVSDRHIAEGLANVSWAGRLQRLACHPYQVLLPSYLELWLDGGHNPQGGEILAAWCKEQKKNIHFICGMVKGKNSLDYLRSLAPWASSFHAIAIPNESDSQSAEEIAKAAEQAGIKATVAPSIENALQTVAGHAKNPGIVCMCGSLYLVGQVLRHDQRITNDYRQSVG